MPLASETLVVRAGAVAAEKFVDHMRREQERYTCRGRPMSSISVDATVAAGALEAILRARLWSRTSYATATAGVLQEARFKRLHVRRAALRRTRSQGRGRRGKYPVLLVGSRRAEPLASTEEVTMTTAGQVGIDIPCDMQQVDETGFVWTFLDETRDPSLTAEGVIVIAADESDSVLARVVKLTPNGSRTLVHLPILPGDALLCADALARPYLLRA